ncbi:MAG: glycosyltransferase family protein [Planktomarina sp.]
MIQIEAVSFLVNNFAAGARFAPLVQALRRDDRFDVQGAYEIQSQHPKTTFHADMCFQYRLPIAGKIGAGRIFEMADRPGLQVLDLDDDQIAQYETFEGGQAAIEYALAAADAIRVSTPFLYDKLKRVHPRVFLSANHLNARPAPPQPRTNTPVHVLMATMQSASALQDVLRSLGAVLLHLGPKVHLTLVGSSFAKVRFRTQNYDVHPFVEHETYKQLFAQADIAILPLGTDAPTLGKSDLKFLDCIAAGTAALADGRLYGGTVKNGITGCLYDTPQSLQKGLIDLVQNADKRNRICQNAYEYGVKERLYFLDHAQRDMDWLVGLWAKKEELLSNRKQRMADMLRPALPTGLK